jgi:hypothetical protein
MDFSDLLQRANLNSMEEYLFHGGESVEEPTRKTYSERLAEARKKATAFFQARFPDIEDYDEITGYFHKQAGVFQHVYFEIGLILGAKIAFQICERMGELK